MNIVRFEDTFVWQKSQDLALTTILDLLLSQTHNYLK